MEETCVQVMDLYQQEQTREGAGGNSATQALRQEEESSYQKKAVLLLNDENCYKFIVVSMHFIRFVNVVRYTVRTPQTFCRFCKL